MRQRPQPLPVDEVLVRKCERLIRTMNRSERSRVHRTLLDEARTAQDKTSTANDNIVATRLPRDAYATLLNMCDDTSTPLSAFMRKVLLHAIKEHAQ